MKKHEIVIAIIITLIIAISYYLFPLWERFSPKCPLKIIFSIECPNCGNQRALNSILHLRFKDAFFYNQFILYTLVCILIIVILEKKKNPNSFAIAFYIYLVGYITWFIIRNIL